MTSFEIKINRLIELFLKRNTAQLSKSEIDGFDELLSDGVLKEYKGNKELLMLNSNSEKFKILFLKFIEKETHKELPKDISEAFKYIEEFKDNSRKKYSINIINAYDEIIKALKVFILQKLKSEKIVKPEEFLFSLNTLETREHHLYDFERIFFKFLPYSDYSINEIAEISLQLWDKNSIERYVIDFLRGYGKINISNANELLNFLYDKKSPARIISNLLIGLYDAGDKNVLDIAIRLKESNLLECLFVLGRLNYYEENDIEKTFSIIEPLNYTNKEIASEQSYFILHLINSPKTTKEIKDSSFYFLIDFIEKGTSEIVESVFHEIIFYLDNNEEEKYKLLHVYLAKTKNVGIIKRFFSNFKDPVYVFNLLIQSFIVDPDYRFPIEIFQDGIHHAWQNNQEKTKNLILDLFNQHPIFSILAVKIILSANRGIYNVDLLKLNKNDSQINAIRSFCKSPIFFDKLLPVILPLRNSEHIKVREVLQKELANKVFNSYHEILYSLIEREVGATVKEKKFLKPIKKALDDYNKLKEVKESIKDIDPIENEKDLMELYYRLEREEHTKMMNKMHEGKGTFMEMVKNTVIVRGNAWKIGDREPSRLGSFESKMLIDGSSYINPELYEHNLNSI